MKLRKMEVYESGYGENPPSGGLKKAVIATAAAAAMAGGLTGCSLLSVSGDMEYIPSEYDGYMSVESVSDSDLSSEPSACSSEDETITLDGDVAYVPSEQG